MLPRGRMERDPSRRRRRRQAMWSAARHHRTRDPVADVDVSASPTETPHPLGLSLSLSHTHDDDRDGWERDRSLVLPQANGRDRLVGMKRRLEMMCGRSGGGRTFQER
ncbi:unnamed protein product [Musa hybrid cultivar]